MKVKNIMFSGFAAAIFAGVCGAADAAVQYELTSKSYVDTELAKKQNNLTAGAGIDITNNVVKTTLDLTPYATTADMETADKDLQDQIDAVKELTGTEGVAEQISAAVNAEKTVREQADTAINNKIGTVADGKTVVEMISDAQTAASYDDTEVRGLISAEATAREQADTAIRSEFADADATTLQSAKDYADGLATNYDAAGSAAAAQAAAEATADAALTAYKTANDAKVNKNTEDIASINTELDKMATSETVTNLTTRVATAEGEIDDLQAADTTIRGEFAAADKVLEDAYKAADTTLDGKISANTQAIADEATARANADTALENAYKAADAEVLAGAKKYTDDEIAELNQSLSGTSTNLGALTTRVETAEGEIDDLQAADTTLDGKISANTQAIEDEATARANADTALENAINAEHFVSANGILTTKGGYLVISDGAGNITLNQVAVVNGDGTTDIITGESLQ